MKNIEVKECQHGVPSSVHVWGELLNQLLCVRISREAVKGFYYVNHCACNSKLICSMEVKYCQLGLNLFVAFRQKKY